MKVLYPIFHGEITGANIICLRIIREALRRNYGVVVNSPTEGKFIDILRKEGIKVYNIDTRHSFRFDSAIKLARIIKEEDIDLVHSHLPLAGTVLSRLGGWLAGVPVVTHIHLADTLNRRLLVGQIQVLLNWVTSRFFCAKIIAVSKNVKREIIKQGAVLDKITVIYNGIDLDDSRPKNNHIRIRQDFGLKQNQRIIGEVGRLCRVKGQHILIEAAQKVIKRNPDIVFMIIGEDLEGKGEYEKNLKKLADNLGLKEKIIFTGYRPDAADLMHTFEFFILPSLAEGLPVVILEAMAAKKAVITTPAGGNAEIVIDSQTGTIVPLENPDKLAEAIIYHLENPEISKSMGQAGYNRVSKEFNMSGMFEQIFLIYDSVLNYN